MASATVSAPSPSLLQRRLSALRRRLYFVISFRGVCWLLAFVLSVAILAGLLDWRLHLPGLVRAVFLVSGLAATGVLAFRLLLQPLAQRTDDLSLALRVEEHYPGFRDALASAVEFLQEPEDSERMGSPSMRREAVRRSMRSVQKCDFNRVVDARGLRTAGASFLGAALIGLALILLHPSSAWTALVRLAVPFGPTEWPKKTQIELDKFRDRIGRTEGFEVRGRLTGVVPEQARVVFRLQGGSQVELVCEVEQEEGVGRFSAALRPGQVQRDFEFQVFANDNSTRPQRISVLPPPVLTPLDGKASPQVRLTFPSYTDLPEQELPDGSGNVEAPAGTVVTLRAAMDRPMGRAWIEQKPENRFTPLGLGLAPLGSVTPLDAVLLASAGPVVWGRAEAHREADPREFTITFQPSANGIYELHFEDETGLPGQRIFELRVYPDPSPEVKLERPRAGRDSLDLLPNAELPLELSIEDPQYAVRSSWLEYRCQKEDPPRRLPLFDHRTAGVGAAALQAALARNPVAPRTQPALFKPGRVPIASRLLLAQIRHLDGSLLKEGDVLTLQAFADDFDDVAVDKAPGKSHEVEIRIISRNALEVILNQEQAKVQQELVRLREQQREAIRKVNQTEQAMRKDGRLDPEELAKLVEAEQAQEQVRERVGKDREEGLRGEVERILDTLKNNQIERSATQERMEQVQRELERIAREDLEQVEPRLTAVRKQNEAAERKPDATKQDQEMLREARERQEEVEKTLSDLLSRMEPWTSTREIKGEVRSLLQEQKKLADETRALQDKGADGKNRDELNDAERAELNRLQEAQRKLEERTAQLLDKMHRVAQERRDKDPETARELENARQAGQESNITGQMQDARSKLERNQLSNAHRDQQNAARKLEELARQLEDRREDELDRMVKKLREAERELERMGDEQEKLQKKAKELQQKLEKTSDPMEQKQLQEELKRLAKEQQQLQQEAEDLVKRLSRMRSERSSQALGKAAEALKRAGEAMARGENNDQEQEEALDRIDEAAEELQRNREEAEEELAREQLAKVAETLKAFRERQAALLGEAGRLQNEALRRKEWTRGLRISLGDLARAQKGLGEEVTDVARERLGGAPVFAKVLRKAAEAMEKAHDRMLERQQELGLNPDDVKSDEETAALQQDALRRLTQLLDAIKEEENRGPRGGGGGSGGDGGGGAGGGEGDAIPPLAQLKLLHDLQAEVNRQTAEFVKKHPDPEKLDDKEKAELRDIQREQKEIAELLEEFARPTEPEPEPMVEKKEEKKP